MACCWTQLDISLRHIRRFSYCCLSRTNLLLSGVWKSISWPFSRFNTIVANSVAIVSECNSSLGWASDVKRRRRPDDSTSNRSESGVKVSGVCPYVPQYWKVHRAAWHSLHRHTVRTTILTSVIDGLNSQCIHGFWDPRVWQETHHQEPHLLTGVKRNSCYSIRESSSWKCKGSPITSRRS